MSSPNLADPYLLLAQILRDARLTARYTQTELADRLGKPQSFVSKYESAERRLDFIEVLEVCAAIDVPVQQVLEAFERARR